MMPLGSRLGDWSHAIMTGSNARSRFSVPLCLGLIVVLVLVPKAEKSPFPNLYALASPFVDLCFDIITIGRVWQRANCGFLKTLAQLWSLRDDCLLLSDWHRGAGFQSACVRSTHCCDS
jgi:hypothetical protein